jgi:hypothetical protein
MAVGETRYYPSGGPYVTALSRYLTERFEQAGYDVQILEEESGQRRTFQMRKRYGEGWVRTASSLAGLDTAATVVMRTSGDDLELQFGGAKWLDKAAVAGAGVLTSFGLLLVPAGIGAWKQRQLLEDLQHAADEFFRHRQR